MEREHTCKGNLLSKFKKNNNNRNSFTKGWFTKSILTDERFLISKKNSTAVSPDYSNR